jgi:hypothetical protein
MILQSSVLLCSNFGDDFDELFEQGKLLLIVLMSTYAAVQNAPYDGRAHKGPSDGDSIWAFLLLLRFSYVNKDGFPCLNDYR